MSNPKFTRKMHSVVKRSLLFGVLIVIVVCLAFGVLGKSLPDRKVTREEEKWYEGKELKLVHVVSSNFLNSDQGCV